MELRLGARTEETVAIYFERAGTDEIRQFLPQKAKTLNEALDDYRQTQLPGATSYGRTIWIDGRYAGDVWCYCIDRTADPNAMLSYCVFETDCRNQGAATEAVRQFITEIVSKFNLHSIGAFTYSKNLPSIRVLEKNGFQLMEAFIEDGMESKYYQLEM